MVKIFELTTNGEDGYTKYLVRGVRDNSHGKRLAKSVFQKCYWNKGIVYYDDVEKGRTESISIEEFMKLKRRFK